MRISSHPADIFFPSVRGVHPSLTLKATVLHDCDNQDSALLDSIGECQIVQDTDVGHERFATYVKSKMVAHLYDAVKHFQLVLDQCPATFERIFKTSTISLISSARPLHRVRHSDHPLSIYHLTEALTWRYSRECTAAYIHESAELCCKLRSITAGQDGVDYVIRECNNLPTDASDEGVHLRRVVLELCSLGNARRPRALHGLAQAVEARFHQLGTIDDLAESIQHGREALCLCPEGHSERDTYLNNLALSLDYRFDHQGSSDDLNEAISLHEEALRLRPVGHKYRNFSLDNLGGALRSRFNQGGDVNDIRSISLRREALMLCPPGNPSRDTTLNNLALALKTRYENLDASEDLDEAINFYRDSLQIQQHGHLGRHTTLSI
ncbi:hypothetical protein BD769DRAFT_497302 [Suillus cothurnatus]|nr:hypothetical protein BD769DRAFT_497302 [Suillus cothurnatus]